jgi:hypothetical protein
MASFSDMAKQLLTAGGGGSSSEDNSPIGSSEPGQNPSWGKAWKKPEFLTPLGAPQSSNPIGPNPSLGGPQQRAPMQSQPQPALAPPVPPAPMPGADTPFLSGSTPQPSTLPGPSQMPGTIPMPPADQTLSGIWDALIKTGRGSPEPPPPAMSGLGLADAGVPQPSVPAFNAFDAMAARFGAPRGYGSAPGRPMR